MTSYDFLQFSVCVFSILAAGFWLQSATSRLPKSTTKASRQGAFVSTSANKSVTMERGGSSVCGNGGLFPICCNAAALRRLKMIHGIRR
jgi:hypothetical protein